MIKLLHGFGQLYKSMIRENWPIFCITQQDRIVYPFWDLSTLKAIEILSIDLLFKKWLLKKGTHIQKVIHALIGYSSPNTLQ